MKLILTAVLNLKFDWMLPGETVSDDYRVTSKEIRKLHKRFFTLAQNRQDFAMRKRTEKKAERQKAREEPTVKPKMCPGSA
jgi:hypothetical protein